MAALEADSFKMAVLLFFVLFSLLGMVAVGFLFGIYRRSVFEQVHTRCCGHCGTGLGREPEREVAMDSHSLLSFRCSKCGKETFFSSADL
jgi:hypothetical protein